MTIETDRLTLSPITERDIVDIHHMNSHAAVARFNTVGIPKSIKDTKALFIPFLSGGSGDLSSPMAFIIRERSDSSFIGEIGLTYAPPRYLKAEVHYSIVPAHWGHGYATDALRAVISYCFDELGLHRIEAGCAVDNLASIRVLEKCGFTKEGRHRKILPLSSGWSDNFSFAILREDREQK